MFRKYCAAGASILVGALATAALSGSSCAINEIAPSGGSAGTGSPPGMCADEVKNGGETDVNCGGPCTPCAVDQACLVAGDCASGVCKGDVCAAPSCTDQVHNGNETDTDCGGICPTCNNDEKCSSGSDCSSSFCVKGACVAQCSTAAKDGDESDIDCGGSCAKCPEGKSCNKEDDCSSAFCVEHTCVSPCHNAMKDGDESDVDCGGSCMTKCSVQWGCKVDADCISNDCVNGFCFPNSNTSSCFDNVKNFTETDIDCGGGGCPGCALNKTCVVDSDCSKSDGSKCGTALKTCQKP
jgi:hypothetical protein